MCSNIFCIFVLYYTRGFLRGLSLSKGKKTRGLCVFEYNYRSAFGKIRDKYTNFTLKIYLFQDKRRTFYWFKSVFVYKYECRISLGK